ncbi:hypothetical protein BDZ89DRAFT_1050949 [Hymenopellis radicata]|nr:hypothetical protein BDZ89DRAFT_1050949 [Hymenopellis radicata]
MAKNRNKDQLNAKARAKYRARKDPSKIDGRTRRGRAAKFETEEEHDATLSPAALNRNLRRKFLRVDARLMAYTNNSLYGWAHDLCKRIMDLGDDSDAATALLSDVSQELRSFLYRAECIEGEISTHLGDGPLLVFVQSYCAGLVPGGAREWTALLSAK